MSCASLLKGHLCIKVYVKILDKTVQLDCEYLDRLLSFSLFADMLSPEEPAAGGGVEHSPLLGASCRVCSSPAAPHLHYGAISCYSCRAFFRRGQPRQARCIVGGGGCVVTPLNRTSCKTCRYNTCLRVGMKPDRVDATLVKRREKEEEKESVRGPGASQPRQEMLLARSRSPDHSNRTYENTKVGSFVTEGNLSPQTGQNRKERIDEGRRHDKGG